MSKINFKRWAVSLFSALTLAVGSGGVASAKVTPPPPPPPPECVSPEYSPGNSENCKIDICHFDNNAKQPWGPKPTPVDATAADGNTGNDKGQGDHSTHTGTIPTTEAEAQAMKTAGEQWGDIIPPHGKYAGLNWTSEGQAIYNNDCQFVEGGQGGGELPPPPPPPAPPAPPVTNVTNVTNTTTTPAPAPAQVVVTPTGGVGAGSGGASQEMNPASVIGLSGSVVALAAGAAWLNRRNLVRG